MYTLHNHTDYSNASRGFSDSSMKVETLIRRAKELGLSGCAITDHEITGSFIEAKKLEKELDFPVILGNEIYLVSDYQDYLLRNEYESGMYYPHFILLALDEIGVRQLWELSARAWTNAYNQRGLIRTTTKMSDIEAVIGKDKGHIVASSACLGSQLGRWSQDAVENPNNGEKRKRQILKFIEWAITTFGDGNFYLEMQPATAEQTEQIEVNNYLLNISKITGVPYIITTDSHYLKKELLFHHSKFLNSKEGGGEREVEKFYKTAYLMSQNEVIEYFKPYWEMKDIMIGIDNTIEIGKRAKRFTLHHNQIIPKIEFKEGWTVDKNFFPRFPENYPYIEKFLNSPHDQDKYLMHLIEEGMKKKIKPEAYTRTFKRIEEELTEFWIISDQIGDRMSAYFVTMNKNIDICWNDANAIVGVGRGSGVSSMTNYLLDITQVNPLDMPVSMPFWRFIDRNRPELPDIDFDTGEHKRDEVYKQVSKYYESIGGTVVKCATYGTIGSKSAIQTAGRGLGYATAEMMNISSMIPTERGFTWTLKDCYYGNEEKGRDPIKEFIEIVDKYEHLMDVAFMIEGLIINRGTHASGIFMFNGKFTDYNSIMQSPDGTLTSQYDLHDSEEMGMVKYDFLTTSALSKIQLTLEMLIKEGYVEWKGNLKDTYMSILDPNTLDFDREEVWESIAKNQVPDLFQFDTTVAIQTVTKIQPKSLVELAQANSLMRLMPQAGAEAPTDTYARFKKDISLWYQEMKEYGVPDEDIPVMEELMLAYKGVLDTQEAIMIASQHPRVSNFTIAESNVLRKAVAKKSEKDLKKIRALFFEKGEKSGANPNTLNYIWNVQIARQLAYSFSILHTIAYTFIALQELVLFHNYPSLFWQTACLTVNAGAIEQEEEDTAKTKSTKYGKVAKAVGDLQQLGVDIVPPYINEAEFGFKPDVKNNRIIFSLKGINGIGDEVAYEIMRNRPYNSLKDFNNKMLETKKIGQTKIINLIKAGCFDEIEKRNRVLIMQDFISEICEPKKKLTTANLNFILEENLLPDRLKPLVQHFNFKRYLFRPNFYVGVDKKFKTKKWYKLDHRASRFFNEHYIDLSEEDKHYKYNEVGDLIVCDKEFDKLFKDKVEPVLEWLGTDEALQAVNNKLFEIKWEQYCNGTVSKWEMDSISFYRHEHELANVNKMKYSMVNFFDLPEEPVVLQRKKYSKDDKVFEYTIYEIDRICGTVLDKDKTKHTVTLLTTNGVVTVKFHAGNFGHYDKQITEQVGDVQKCIEKSWFSRGTLLAICGYRFGETFKPKKYSHSTYQHTVMKILEVTKDGELLIQTDRLGGKENE